MAKAHAAMLKRRKAPRNQDNSPRVESTIDPQPQADIAPILALQSSVGNRAVQRLMTESDLGGRLPAKTINKVGKLFGTKKSKSNRDTNNARSTLLAAVRAVHSYSNREKVSHRPSALQGQLGTVGGLYDAVVMAADVLLAMIDDPSDERYAPALEAKVQATNEKTAAIEKFLDRLRNPPQAPAISTVAQFLSGIAQPVYMNPNLMSGKVGGGMNELTKYGSEKHGNEYFKPNIESLDSYGSLEESDRTEHSQFGGILNSMMENSGRLIDSPEAVRGLNEQETEGIDFGQHGNKEGFVENFDTHIKKGINTEFLVHGGINVGDLRSSQREVAMARLDTLLGSDLISKANLAIKKTGVSQVPQLGSVAPEAKGKDITKYNLVDNQQQHPGTKDTISKEDPTLLSKVSALYLIDFLAGQVDRHQGNYMIQTDRNGNVIRITGIDNDMAFGTRDSGELARRGGRQLPILGMYFDSDMAAKILALDPELIRMAMSDLLIPDEIQAIIDRLTLLKAKLQTAQQQNQLLQPGQWANLIRTAPTDFERSDYAKSIIDSV